MPIFLAEILPLRDFLLFSTVMPPVLHLNREFARPNQCAAANRQQSLRSTMTYNLNIFTAFLAHCRAVAELDR